MPHRRTLDGLSRPGLRLQGWRRLPAGSKIAVVILALIAAMAILAHPYTRTWARGILPAASRRRDTDEEDVEEQDSGT